MRAIICPAPLADSPGEEAADHVAGVRPALHLVAVLRGPAHPLLLVGCTNAPGTEDRIRVGAEEAHMVALPGGAFIAGPHDAAHARAPLKAIAAVTHQDPLSRRGALIASRRQVETLVILKDGARAP